MKLKKYIIFLFLIFFQIPCFSQQRLNYLEKGINMELNYFGLPLELNVGYLHRHNNSSIFPYIGLNFDVQNTYSLKTQTGISFIYKNWFWNNQISYELLPAFLEKNFSFIDFKTSGGYTSDFFRFNLPFNIGYKKFRNTNEEDLKSLYLAININFDTFIIDNGILKITSLLETNLVSVFEKKFNYLNIDFSLPCTFYLSIFELGIRYDFIHTNEINFKSINPIEKIKISFPYSKSTKRLAFISEKKDFLTINSLDFEQRFYFLRTKNISSNLFISLFENIGFGLDIKNNIDFLWQLGFGLGYNLYDSVPFTVQFGINQDKDFVLFIGVISNINHKP